MSNGRYLWIFALGMAAATGPRPAFADTFNNNTAQSRYTDTQNNQTYNLSSANGGMVTIGTGTAADGSTRLDLSPGGVATSALRMESNSTVASPVTGDHWNDSTRLSIARFVDGMTEYAPGLIYSSTGSVIQGTTSESTVTARITTAFGTVTLPASSFIAGKVIRYRLIGQMSTVGANPPTLNINVKIGTTTVLTTGARTLIAAMSSCTFTLDGVLVSTATGNFLTGSASGGFCLSFATATATNGAPAVMCSNAIAPATYDTTTANDFNITATFNSANGSNLFWPNSIVYYREN